MFQINSQLSISARLIVYVRADGLNCGMDG